MPYSNLQLDLVRANNLIYSMKHSHSHRLLKRPIDLRDTLPPVISIIACLNCPLDLPPQACFTSRRMPVHSRGIQGPVPLFRSSRDPFIIRWTRQTCRWQGAAVWSQIVFETAKDYHLADAMWLILYTFPARLFLHSWRYTTEIRKLCSNSDSELRTDRQAFVEGSNLARTSLFE
jgi:hypothetical protein